MNTPPNEVSVILLEPLNKYEAYPGVLTTVHDGIRVIDESGFDNLGLQTNVLSHEHLGVIVL